MIELRRCIDEAVWDEYVLEAGGHPLQLWGWGQVKSDHGWQAERLFGVNGDGAIIAAAQVLVKRLPFPFRAFAYVPRGPAADASADGDFLNGLAGFIKREYHAVTLSVEPQTDGFQAPDGWRRSENSILPSETITLDLAESESSLLAAMAKKTRQYIRKSAADITIRPVKTEAELEKCFEIYHQTAIRAGFRLHDDDYYRDVFSRMKDHSPVFAAYEDDRMVAFLWLAISMAIAFELYGGMTERGQELRANYALKWQVIRKIKEWGLSTYDFGGLIGGGVGQFKQGWATDPTVLPGTFDKPLSPLYAIWHSYLPTAKKIFRMVKR